MHQTKIEWTDATWNPTTGCTKISQGCRNCYAERIAKRLAGRFGYPEVPHHFDVTLHPDRLLQPTTWRKRRFVFVDSMSDLFHPQIPFEYIRQVFAVMAVASEHVFQILTKRPQRMLEFMKWYQEALHADGMPSDWLPLNNVHLGVSTERFEYLWRADILLRIPASIHFLSFEPLLGPIEDIHSYLMRHFIDGPELEWHKGTIVPESYPKPRAARLSSGIDWVIVGGESGPGARPMHPDWARSLRDQCQAAGIPFFFKQHGAWLHESQFTTDEQREVGLSSRRCEAGDGFQYIRVGKKAAGRILDGRTWNEFPIALES